MTLFTLYQPPDFRLANLAETVKQFQKDILILGIQKYVLPLVSTTGDVVIRTRILDP